MRNNYPRGVQLLADMSSPGQMLATFQEIGKITDNYPRKHIVYSNLANFDWHITIVKSTTQVLTYLHVPFDYSTYSTIWTHCDWLYLTVSSPLFGHEYTSMLLMSCVRELTNKTEWIIRSNVVYFAYRRQYACNEQYTK